MSDKPKLVDINIEQEFPKERPDYWIQCKFSNYRHQSVKVKNYHDIEGLVAALHLLADNIARDELLIPRDDEN